MSLKLRGQEVTVKIAVEGVVRGGSMFKTRSWEAKPRGEIKEDDHLGEDETDLDHQHHGWDLSCDVNTIDSEACDLIDETIEAARNHKAPPNVTITVIHRYREPKVRAKAWVYHEVVLIGESEGAASRKDNYVVKLSGKCKQRSPLVV